MAVLAAGGKTARAVGIALSAASLSVRLASRQTADVETGRGLIEALSGCRALWFAAPNMHPDEPGLVERVLEAASRTGVERVIYHSVAWPYAPSMPHHLGKAEGENLVRRSGLSFTILQPCAYMQNLVPFALTGRIAVPYSLDARFTFVDLDDVAAATAVVLAEPGHEGATYELAGPDILSVRDVALIASSVLSQPVSAERQSRESWLAGPGAGLSTQVRAWLLAMFEAYDAHGLSAGRLTLPRLLGREATRVRTVLARSVL